MVRISEKISDIYILLEFWAKSRQFSNNVTVKLVKNIPNVITSQIKDKKTRFITQGIGKYPGFNFPHNDFDRNRNSFYMLANNRVTFGQK